MNLSRTSGRLRSRHQAALRFTLSQTSRTTDSQVKNPEVACFTGRGSLLYEEGACFTGFEPALREGSLLYGIRACFTGFEPALREGSLSKNF